MASTPVRIQVNSATASTPTTEAHNDLLGLQGGSATQRYHLDLAQYNDYAGKSYIDGSIGQVWTKLGSVDTSLNNIWTKFGSVDTSLNNLGIKNANQDTSINNIWTKLGSVDTSLNNLGIKDANQDTSIYNLGVKNTNQDVSINNIWTKFGSVDTSLNNLGIKDANQDTSIYNLGVKDGYQDTSIYDNAVAIAGIVAGTVTGWNGITKTADNSIGLGGDLKKDTVINTGTWQLGITGSMQITGDLTVDGSITYLNTNELDVSDNIININTGMVGTPPVNMVSGIRINRGDASDYYFIFSEATDTFRIGINASEGGLAGETQAVATRQDSPQNEGIAFWNNTANRFDTVSDFKFNATTGLTISDRITGSGGLTLSGLDASTQTYALMVPATGGGVVSTRALGSNAFNSDTYVLKTLFDTSLNAVWTKFGYVDTSLNNIWTKFGYVDTSILNLGIKDAYQDTSIYNLGVKNTNQDTSIAGLNTLTISHTASIAQLDASIVRIDASLNDVIDILDLGFTTNASVNSAFAARDISILWLDTNKVDLAGDTMTGTLNVPTINAVNASLNTISTGTLNIDSVGIIAIDTSAEGLSVGLDTHIPTSALVKAAIDSAISAGVTADNGLNENTPGNIQLGGTLNTPTTIDISTHSLTLSNLVGGTTRLAVISDGGVLKTQQLGTMALATASDYYTAAQVNSAISAVDTSLVNYTDTTVASAVGAVDSSLVTYTNTAIEAVDTSLVAYVDGKAVTIGAANGLRILADGSVGLGGTLTDSSTIIITNGQTNSLRITGLTTSTNDTPYALVQESAGGDLYTRQLGTMAWEASINYVGKALFDSSLNGIWTKFGYVDTSLNNIWTKLGYVDTSISTLNTWNVNQDISIANISSAQGNYVKIAGDLMTGGLQVGTVGAQRDVSIYGGLYVHNGATIGGDLYVDGSLYVTNVQTIDVSAGFIRLNTGMTGTPPASMQSGIAVERGDLEPYVFIFDENTQDFRIGIAVETSTGFLDASTQAVATRQDSPTDTAVAYWNQTLNRFDTASGFTYASGVLTTPDLTLTDLPADAGTTSLMITGNVVGTRTLGSNAFTSTTYAVKADVDSSLNGIWVKLGSVDTSLNSIWTKFGSVDTSLNNIWTKFGSVDTSLLNLGIKDAAIDTSLNNIWTKLGYVDTSINNNAAAIKDLSTNKLSGAANINVAGDASLYSYTNATHIAQFKKIVAGSGATITEDVSTITIAVSGAAGYVSKYTGTFSADGSTSMAIAEGTHNLGVGPLTTAVYEGTEQVYVGVDNAGNGDITLTWTPASLSGICKFVITG